MTTHSPARLSRLLLAAFSALAVLAAPSSAVWVQADDSDPAAVDQAPSPEAVALARVNDYRLSAGVTPARLNPALMQSATGQVAYYDLHLGDPSLAGMGLHQQQPGADGFTGATMGDRARAAGYQNGAVTENAGFGTLTAAIDWAMGTVNHRLPLIHPSALDMGFAVSDASRFNIISVGVPREKLAVTLPSVYPPDGATDVPLAWDGGEAPDPAPGIPRPLGYPITVAFAVYQRVEWRAFELDGPDGQPLAISTPVTDWMRAAAIVPHAPLEPGQTYRVHVEALVDGAPLVRNWSFTTLGGS